MSLAALTLIALCIGSGSTQANSEPYPVCDSATVAAFTIELEEMYVSDQKFRSGNYTEEDLLADDSVTVREVWDVILEVDAKNLARLEEIVAECGWPERSKFGHIAASGAFLVLQHADLEKQQQYFNIFRAAAEKNEANLSDVAMMKDRILMREGKLQIYGTQITRNPGTGEWELYQVIDFADIDTRRASVGLGPISEYLKRFGIEYTPPLEDSAK